MNEFIGFDTSNYTTSAAAVRGGKIIASHQMMLPVKNNRPGLRQSDALFAHTANMPALTEKLGRREPAAVGCSSVPRDVPGSYMPCFLAGVAAASAVSNLLGIPLYKYSHQAGHIAAALYGCGKTELWHSRGEFLAFHVSGGTTEMLHVKNRIINRIGAALDINAGQAVDRIGLKLGLKFPCGPELEKLSLGAELPDEPLRISIDECSFNLSGLENKAADLIKRGVEPASIALYTIEFINLNLIAAAENALKLYPDLPLICAGGVMSNKLIAKSLQNRFNAYFAPPELSKDNAAGIALLTEMEYTDGK